MYNYVQQCFSAQPKIRSTSRQTGSSSNEPTRTGTCHTTRQCIGLRGLRLKMFTSLIIPGQLLLTAHAGTSALESDDVPPPPSPTPQHVAAARYA